MEPSFGLIIGTIKSLIGAIFTPIKKLYFDQPKLFIVFEMANSSQRLGSISRKNDTTRAIPTTEAIYHYSFNWEYYVSLRNNSEHTLYNIKVIHPKLSSRFSIQPKLDSLKPLTANDEVKYRFIFNDDIECNGHEANKITKTGPTELKEKLIFEYTNVKGKKFYTYFDLTKSDDDRHSFSRKILTK